VVDGTPVRVRISELDMSDSPRLSGIDESHVQVLAGLDEPLPPILVHYGTMRVIDGIHRLRAAQLRGAAEIDAQFFHGSAAEAFLVAVRANVTHGLPLTLEDRRAAVARIMASHPELSDRSVAATAGLSARTVAGIRRCYEHATAPHRLGKDGRVRPLSAVGGRQAASEILTERPESSLREVARLAGISVGTARDVRARIRAGQPPTPPDRPHSVAGALQVSTLERAMVDTGSLIEGLRRDPSIRYSERGRTMLRWLALRVITPGQYRDLIDSIPPHGANVLARIARECARVWADFAQELDQKSADSA
jgi:ParB-like chromosome segregation protein Spo0J